MAELNCTLQPLVLYELFHDRYLRFYDYVRSIVVRFVCLLDTELVETEHCILDTGTKIKLDLANFVDGLNPLRISF